MCQKCNNSKTADTKKLVLALKDAEYTLLYLLQVNVFFLFLTKMKFTKYRAGVGNLFG